MNKTIHIKIVTIFVNTIILILFGHLFAQVYDIYLIKTDTNGDTIWIKVYSGGSGHSGQQTSDGGYIVAGPWQGGISLLKTDSVGDSLWTNTYGGLNCYSVQQTTDSGYIVTGWIRSAPGNTEVYLIKTDSLGDTLWTKTYGGPYRDAGYSVHQTTNDGYIIAGLSWLYENGDSSNCDVYLIKTDSSGDTLWTKTYGAKYIDIAQSVQQTTDGGFIICGYTESFGPGGYDVYLIKTDANGDTLWTKAYGGLDDDKGYEIQQTFDGGYIIAGETYSFGGGKWDFYLLKTDANGDTLWTKTFGGPEYESARSVQQTSDSCYLFTGTGGIRDNVLLVKFDANGDTLWTKEYGDANRHEGAFSVKQTFDGGYVIVGRRGQVRIEEETNNSLKHYYGSTIISGPLRLPKGKKCKVYDISGRAVAVNNLKSGIYFIEIEGKISQKVVKIK